MSKLYRNSTRDDRIMKRLPSLTNYVDLEAELQTDQIIEALNLSFPKFLKKNLPPSLYSYFLNQRSDFADIVSHFGVTGNSKSLLQDIRYRAEKDQRFHQMDSRMSSPEKFDSNISAFPVNSNRLSEREESNLKGVTIDNKERRSDQYKT